MGIMGWVFESSQKRIIGKKKGIICQALVKTFCLDLMSQLYGCSRARIMISKYLKYSILATKPCSQSASSTPAVWPHDLSLHNHGTRLSTRCCNHMLTSNTERDVCSTTTIDDILYCVCCILSLIYSCMNIQLNIKSGKQREESI